MKGILEEIENVEADIPGFVCQPHQKIPWGLQYINGNRSTLFSVVAKVKGGNTPGAVYVVASGAPVMVDTNGDATKAGDATAKARKQANTNWNENICLEIS